MTKPREAVRRRALGRCFLRAPRQSEPHLDVCPGHVPGSIPADRKLHIVNVIWLSVSPHDHLLHREVLLPFFDKRRSRGRPRVDEHKRMVMYTVCVPERMMAEIEALMTANPEAPQKKAAVIRDLLAVGLKTRGNDAAQN